MGKNDFLTPKAIANRIKAKGLQKLRWYCQMCQKQCRDENGFKCHCMSESHQRQMQIFGQNPNRILDGYSQEFEEAFMDLMRRSHRLSRVAATVVYNEYINDRHHVHMNSTQWATLTEFVKYLGKTGKCKVEETPKGWFITYIGRDSETLFKEKMKNKRLRADAVDEEKQLREIKKQIERAEQSAAVPFTCDAKQKKQELNLEAGVKIAFALGSKIGKGREKGESSSRMLFIDDEESEQRSKKVKLDDGEGSKSALEELMLEEERKKDKINRKEYWLCEGIEVKVISEALAKKGYYMKKGVVRKVIGKDACEIEIKILDEKHVLRVDQKDLETVLPPIGGLVRIVNGAYRGSNARLLGISEDKFCAKVQIEKGIYGGRLLNAVAYDDICKLSL